jgi:ParB family chromosome partitioning protein
MTVRKPIGRTLTKLKVDTTPGQVFTLKSGQQATFNPEQLTGAELEDKTFVIQQNNGRDQSALTEEAVADISRTIILQQFLPAIGRYVDDSRRRAAAIYKNVGLFVLVTNDNISTEDARQLVKDIQTAREHNLREVGLQLQTFEAQGMKQKDIAKLNGLSEAKVSRALQAAKVPKQLLSVFPDQAVLNYPDYKFLLDTCDKFKVKNLELDDLVTAVNTQFTQQVTPSTTEDAKRVLMSTYKQTVDIQLSKRRKARAIVTPLHRFDNKNQYARKRVDGRKVSYEFLQLPEGLQAELEQLIADKVKAHFT